MAARQMRYEINDRDKRTENGIPYKDFLEWIETIIFAFFAVILVFTFVLRQANVDGDSMNPTLEDGQRLIVTHIGYTPSVGDIVIVDCGNTLGKAIVKRVIATEGQTVNIDFENGIVYVDGVALEEDYIAELTYKDEGGWDYPVTVPTGCVFVMGDNRNNSLDSRSASIGMVDVDNILGKAVFRIYPFDKIGVLE